MVVFPCLDDVVDRHLGDNLADLPAALIWLPLQLSDFGTHFSASIIFPTNLSSGSLEPFSDAACDANGWLLP